MLISFDENFRVGVDCCAVIGERRHIVFGWHLTPRGLPVELSFVTTDGRLCLVEYISRHPRPDVVPEDPGAAVVGGFTLVVVAPHAARGLVLTVTHGDQSGYANVTDAAVLTDLGRATEERDWSITFALLKETMQRPDALPLLDYQYRPYGAFADWLERLPLVPGSGANISVVRTVAASASPTGEIFLDIGFIGRSRETVRMEVLALARLRCEDGGLDRIAMLPLRDAAARHLPGSSAFYARLDPEHVARLVGVELIVEIAFDQTRVHLRCQPQLDSVPGFLDMVGAAPAGQPGQALLRQVLGLRTEAITALLDAEEARHAAAPPAVLLDRPELALIGVDDQAAGRLLHLLAPELEAVVSAVLLLGAGAEEAAQVFARRGRVKASVAPEAGAIVERAAQLGAGNLIALDLPRLAAAAIEGHLPGLLGRARLGGLGQLLLLHMAAGPTPSLGDSLARFATLAEDPRRPWSPVPRDWRSSVGAELVNGHLEDIWRLAPMPISGAECDA